MAEKNVDALSAYIRWRGDLSFEIDPFNEVDNAVLSELAYLDFAKVIRPRMRTVPTIRQVYQMMQIKNCYRLLTTAGGQEDFVAAAAESRRFGSIGVSDYQESFEKDRVQFAAVCFRLDKDTSYIAFRGTDNSIIGWREDFMTSFMKIPGQELAVDYLNSTMKEDHRYYIGGHSKGGNLAVYSASMLEPDRQGQILKIFDNDGPGFSPDVYDLSRIKSISGLITKIIPEYDVIGQLFRRAIPDIRIIRSSVSGILQHDLITWRPEGNHFLKAPRLDPSVKVLNDTFDEWIRTTPPQSRAAFVKDVFDSMEVKGAVMLDDLKLTTVPDILKSMLASSDKTKEALKNLEKVYVEKMKKQAGLALGTFAEEQIVNRVIPKEKSKKKK